MVLFIYCMVVVFLLVYYLIIFNYSLNVMLLIGNKFFCINLKKRINFFLRLCFLSCCKIFKIIVWILVVFIEFEIYVLFIGIILVLFEKEMFELFLNCLSRVCLFLEGFVYFILMFLFFIWLFWYFKILLDDLGDFWLKLFLIILIYLIIL